MSTETIEQRLTELAARVERLEKTHTPAANPDWRQAFGALPDDAASRTAAGLGEEWRKSEGSGH